MAFHTDIGYFWYGWVGLPFFFVLSGFLITGILVDSREATNYFSTFYARRSLRIFPVYYLLLFIVILISIGSKADITDAGLYIFYVQNFKLSYHHFGISFPRYMNHTWSLAVEEQFYIFFPLMVRYIKPKYLMSFCLFLIIAAISTRYILAQLIPGNEISWANTVSNLDFLATGALIAIAVRKYDLTRIRNFSLVLLVACFGAYALYLRLILHAGLLEFPFSGAGPQGQAFFALLLPVIAFSIISLVKGKNLFIRLFFENKFIVYIGKISYGIYLFHFPCFAFTDYYFNHAAHPLIRFNGYAIALLKFLITISLAMISWRYFESRILAFKSKFNYKFLGNENCAVGG